MARLCGVCNHPRRAAIDEALLRHAESYRGIARRFGLEDDALRRHEVRHLHWSWQLSTKLQALMNTDRLVARIEAMESIADDVLEQAARLNDQRLRLLAIAQVRANCETLFKIGVGSALEARLAALEQEKQGEH